jgi:hypothetical protein
MITYHHGYPYNDAYYLNISLLRPYLNIWNKVKKKEISDRKFMASSHAKRHNFAKI